MTCKGTTEPRHTKRDGSRQVEERRQLRGKLSDTPSDAAVGSDVDEGLCTSKSTLTEMSVEDIDK